MSRASAALTSSPVSSSSPAPEFPHDPRADQEPPIARPLASQLPVGKLIELAANRAGCQMTQAAACLRQAQYRGDTCAWVQLEGGSLFPPDLAESDIDLQALTIVHVPRAARLIGLAKAAELLLRSGGFGLVVLDLWNCPRDDRSAWQGRLLGMAREHQSQVVLLSPPSYARFERPASAPGRGERQWRAHAHAYKTARGHDHGSLGPLISLRLHTSRTRIGDGRFTLTTHVLKDKSGSLGALAEERRRGPWGYR